MRVTELLRYTQGFYPRWDATYARQLMQRFGLGVEALHQVGALPSY